MSILCLYFLICCIPSPSICTSETIARILQPYRQYTCCTQTDNYLLMSRTKTNRRTEREQYTRSNGATAKLLTLVKLAETLARDWPNRNERREMVTLIITLLSTIYRRSIKSFETSATCIMYSTDYYQRLTLESWFANLKQKPLNRNQQLPAPHKQLIDGIR